jgi:hypothetical protein
VPAPGLIAPAPQVVETQTCEGDPGARAGGGRARKTYPIGEAIIRSDSRGSRLKVCSLRMRDQQHGRGTRDHRVEGEVHVRGIELREALVQDEHVRFLKQRTREVEAAPLPV